MKRHTALILSIFLVFSTPSLLLAAPKETTVTILRVESAQPETLLKLTAGSEKGVTTQTTGYLVDRDGNRVKGGELTVVKIENKWCQAKVGLSSQAIDGSYRAVLVLP